MIYERFEKQLPLSVKALIHETPDGDYIILFNPHYSREELLESVRHELEHIEDRDFENRDMKDINAIEYGRHGLLPI